jgi:cytosine/adenosine deaminase-related metal-dependent hydrolase
MNILLKGLRWNNGMTSVRGDVRVSGNSIIETGEMLKATKSETVCLFDNHFIYPGLINAHDHLEMNLYPRLGTPPYHNYVEWANDIYKPKKSPLREIEKLPIEDRLFWGGLKNLISGVTTVVHHNPWHRLLGNEKFPVRVLKKMTWAHSLEFGKEILKNYDKNNAPFVIHAAEGIDLKAHAEIDSLMKLGVLHHNTVIIHAVAIDQAGIKIIARQNASVVWCPSSNTFMFGKTAPIGNIKKEVRVTLGSDSTLTGQPTFFDEIRAARETGCATEYEIYDMVTAKAANIFNLPTPVIAHAQIADFFISPVLHEDYYVNLASLASENIVMTTMNGNVRLCDEERKASFPFLKNKITINGSVKYLDVDVKSLKERIARKAGIQNLVGNPLWDIIDA